MTEGYLQQPFIRQEITHESGKQLLDYVRKQKVPEALKCLSDGANPDYQDPVTKDTALHIAVEKYNVVLVKLMVIFDADLTITNKEGLTPLELAKKEGDKAKECYDVLFTIQNLRDKLQNVQPRVKKASEPRTPSSDDVYLITLDGGGIMGLTFIQVLLEIERRRKQLYPESQPFLSYFNWVGGNSTGGLATLAFAGQNTSPGQGRKLYLNLKNKILAGPPPYPREQVNSVLQDAYGTAMTMADIKDVNVTVMTTIATFSPPKLHKMCNYGGERDGQLPPDKRLVWEAARATSAAVPYFHPFDIFIDGGFIANNPTTDTIIDIVEYRKKEGRPANIKLVLSMGCGYIPPKSIDEPDFSPIPKWLQDILDKLHLDKVSEALMILKNLHGVTTMLEVVMAQITQPNEEVNQRAKYLAESIGAKFFRLNPQIDPISFTETNDALLINMMYMAMVSALEDHEEIDEILDLVVGGRDQS